MVKPFVNAFLNLFLPPQCLRCEERVEAHGTLCVACWEGMNFITPPMCSSCGLPFAYGDEGMLCASCLDERPEFSAARASFRFDEGSKDLIHKLKFGKEKLMQNLLIQVSKYNIKIKL
jgi:predicted amidophosphoribosyltransferase